MPKRTATPAGTARRSMSAAAGATALGLMLASCGGDGDSGAVEIDFYYPIAVGGPLESVIDGYIEQFEDENPDVEVTPVYSGDYEQTLASVQSATQAGNPPALTVLGANNLVTLDDLELMTPIGEIVDDEEWLGSFEEGFMTDSTLDDGTVASIPFQRSTVVMYWNKELFEEAGLDPEAPPESWDDMVESGEQVMDGAGAQWGVQIPSTTWGVWMLEAMVIQNGTMLWDPDSGTEVSYDDPATITALGNWQDLQEEGLEPSGTVDWGTLPDDFADGGTGIIWTTTGQLTNIRENADFDFGVAPLPAQEQPGSPTGGGNLYVMNGVSDEEQEAAVELTRFLSSPEIQADWTVESGYVAPLEEAWETEPLASYVEDFPEAMVAVEQLDDAKPEFGVYNRQEAFDVMGNSIEEVMGGADVESTLEEAQEQADDLLQEHR
ncbi:ABC transporter substrate-binding protein [Nocardiopsis oceani]